MSQIRVRIHKSFSNYRDELGLITGSMCDGTFNVEVQVEGNPILYLKPEEIEPC
jgi:hypothetical protein